MFSNRSLYDRTLETFPSAFLVLAGSIGLLLSVLNLFLFTQRKRLLFDRFGNPINGYVPENGEKDGEKEKEVEEDVQSEESKNDDIVAIEAGSMAEPE